VQAKEAGPQRVQARVRGVHVEAAQAQTRHGREEGCGVVWCGVVWCGVVWCGVVWWSERVISDE
jgi:hypothetical protein